MTTTKKKQTRKSVSMPGYVYDAFQVACERAGVPVAAQTERLVRAWLSEQTGEALVVPEREARRAKEPRAMPDSKNLDRKAKPKREKKPRGPSKALTKALDAIMTEPAPTDEGLAKEPPAVVSEVKTDAGILVTYADGMEIEHLDEPTEEMEAAADPALEPVAEPEVEEYVDDRVVVLDEF